MGPDDTNADDADDRVDVTSADEDDRGIAADADDVREFLERMVDEPAAPMTEKGIINNP